MEKKIVVNADDFGITEGVSRAIIHCHEVGALRSTTLMVGMEAARFAVEQAKSHPDLGVGLHFTLTLGRPVAPVQEVASLLSANGEFRSRRQQEKAMLTGKVSASHICLELKAQMQRFLDFGLKPTHIDSHQHIHMMPPVFDEAVRVAASMGIPLRMPWLSQGLRKGLKNAIKSTALQLLLFRNKARMPKCIVTNQNFCSLFDLTHAAGEADVEMYRTLLSKVGGSTELMVHPAIADDNLRRLIGISDMGAKEYEMLRSKEFLTVIEELGFTQSTYAEISTSR